MSALRIPSKYMRDQGIVYVATSTIRAGQVFIVEGDEQALYVKVARKPRGVLRRKDVYFKPLRPLW